MAITYAAGTNTITVTGYTEATPCNFTDIYNADVAGAWGKVTRQCTNQFCFDCRLQVGDGSTVTWAADTSKHIIFTETPYNENLIKIHNHGHLRFGKLEGGHRTSEGCSIIYTRSDYARIGHYGSTNTYFESYSSQYIGLTGRIAIGSINHLTMYNNLLVKNTEISNAIDASAPNTDVYNLTQQKPHHGVAYPAGTWDRIDVSGATYGIYISNPLSPMKITNAIYSNNTTFLYAKTMNNHAIYLVNVITDNWNFTWDGVSSKYVYRQYEFDLKVVDKDNVAINGATVKVWDKNSNLIVDTTTNASGVIATQTITRGYYDQAHGNTLQEASPHLIKITKAGYTTYEADFTLDAKTDWTIALQTSILRDPSMTGGMV